MSRNVVLSSPVELILQSLANIFELKSSFKEVVILSLYVSLFAAILSSIVSIYLTSYMAIKNFLGKLVDWKNLEDLIPSNFRSGKRIKKNPYL